LETIEKSKMERFEGNDRMMEEQIVGTGRLSFSKLLGRIGSTCCNTSASPSIQMSIETNIFVNVGGRWASMSKEGGFRSNKVVKPGGKEIDCSSLATRRLGSNAMSKSLSVLGTTVKWSREQRKGKVRSSRVSGN
jgi:hypothetical protein